jgi:hypothetical protein
VLNVYDVRIGASREEQLEALRRVVRNCAVERGALEDIDKVEFEPFPDQLL